MLQEFNAVGREGNSFMLDLLPVGEALDTSVMAGVPWRQVRARATQETSQVGEWREWASLPSQEKQLLRSSPL